MAINPETQYPGKIAPSSAQYPYGQARNITVPSDGTGTPWEAAIVNDLFGMQQALLDEASIVPSGSPDEVGGSQYLAAIQEVSRGAQHILTFNTLDQLGLVDADFDGATLTVLTNAMPDDSRLSLDVNTGAFPFLSALMPSPTDNTGLEVYRTVTNRVRLVATTQKTNPDIYMCAKKTGIEDVSKWARVGAVTTLFEDLAGVGDATVIDWSSSGYVANDFSSILIVTRQGSSASMPFRFSTGVPISVYNSISGATPGLRTTFSSLTESASVTLDNLTQTSGEVSTGLVGGSFGTLVGVYGVG